MMENKVLGEMNFPVMFKASSWIRGTLNCQKKVIETKRSIKKICYSSFLILHHNQRNVINTVTVDTFEF